MQVSQLSQRRGPLREAGLLPVQRTRPFTALGYAGCSSRAVSQRRRRASGVLAAADVPSSTQGNQSPPPPPPRPQAPRFQTSWLARAVGQAALLLPLAALSLGILGPRSAAWAKPPVQGPAPVAQRTDASELIDEDTGTVQQWLYTRGPWNQRQYGTIHKFYTDRQAAEAEQVARYASATAGAKAVQQGAAAEQQAGAPSVAASAIAAQLLPTRTVSGSAAAASPAAGIPSPVSDALAHLTQLGARVTDAVSGVRVSSVNLSGVNLNDPQVQRSAAVVGATLIALLMFWGRQAQHAQHMSSEAGGNAGSSADDSYDAAGNSDSHGSNAGGKPAAAAAAAGGGSTDIYTKEEVQVLAQQRIEAGKQQVAEEQRRLAEVGAAGAAVTASAAGARQDRQQAAEVVVLTDMEVIADGGSVGKFTTDAAAARAIADEGHAQAAAAAAEAAATAAAAAEAEAAAATEAEAEAGAAAAAQAEKQRAAAASLEAAAAEERRQQEAETARVQAAAQAAAQAAEQRAAAASLEAGAAEERQQQRAVVAARAAQVAVVESTAVMVATAADKRRVIGSSFGVDSATEEAKLQPAAAAAAALAPATAAISAKPVVAPVPATAAATAMSAPPPVTGTPYAAPVAVVAAGVPPNAVEARAWIAAWKGKAAGAEAVEPRQAANKATANDVAPAELAPQHAPSMAQAVPSTASGMSGFFAAASNVFRGFGFGGKAAAATSSLAVAAAAPALTGGAMLTIGSAPGSGRSLEAATGRAVAAALAAVAADAQRSAAAAVSAAVRVESLQQQEVLASGLASAGQKKQWDPVSLLLAPAAPLLAGLASGSGSGRAKVAKGGNKYDMLLSMLSAAAAAPAVQEDSKYDPVRAMLAAVPASGVPRYDFARSLLRGMVSEDSSSDDGAFDMAHGLLERVRSGEVVPTGGSSYDPVWALLKEAALLEEWGMLSESRYDPWSGITDWVGPVPAGTPSRYDPWKDLVQAAWEGQQAFEASKYARDPLRQFIRDFAAPKGASRYDPAVGLFALAGSEWQGPTGRGKYCMVAAALDAAAGWEVPTGDSRYCPMSDFLNAAEGWEAPAGRGSFDPLAWLLNGWAGGWQQPAGSRSKYDPAALVLKAQPALHSDQAKFDPLSHLAAGDLSISPPKARPTGHLFSQFTGGARGRSQPVASEPELVQAVPSGMSDWN